MLAVINVDACPFSAFSDLTCHLEDTGIGALGYNLRPFGKGTINLKVATKRLFYQ